jgi:hypothetical protein
MLLFFPMIRENEGPTATAKLPGDVWGVWCENKGAHLTVAATMAKATTTAKARVAGLKPLALHTSPGVGERWGLVSRKRWIFLIPMI